MGDARLPERRGAAGCGGHGGEVPGGHLRVDKVTPKYMAEMQVGKFAQSAMSMSATGMDMAPEGQQRFTVEVTPAAENGDIAYSPVRLPDLRRRGGGVRTG
jgi:hypothetical protein